MPWARERETARGRLQNPTGRRVAPRTQRRLLQDKEPKRITRRKIKLCKAIEKPSFLLVTASPNMPSRS